MAQVSYGTITITDTNDIESITVEYAQNQDSQNPPTSGWSTTRPDWANGYYIWQRTRIHKSGTSASADTFGAAVCLTGSTGETGATGAAGRSLTSTTTEYTRAAANATIDETNMGSYTWTSNVPTYSSSAPAYWVRVTNVYSNPSSTEYIIYKDNGITDAVSTSVSANDTAQQTQTNLNNYITSNDAAISSIQNKTKYFWSNTNGTLYPVGTYAASGIDNVTFDYGDASTYGYNTRYANGIELRYNAINLGKLNGTSLIFYNPSTSSQGGKGMELTSTDLTFYNPTTNQAQLTLSANGSLQSGNYIRGNDTKFANAGTKIDLTAGDIITQYFRLSQGGETGGPNAGAYIYGTIEAIDGAIGSNSTNYWEIGNDTDYNLQDSAKMIGHGSSFIQLGDSSTWRLATNRIHTGWYISTDSYLHFPEFTNGSEIRRWDYGIHVPTSKGDKFLYIRNASSTTALSNLVADLEDTNTTPYWVYKFYIDGEGNLITTGSIDAHDIRIDGVSIAGGSLVAGSLSSYGGTSNRPVYFPSTDPNKGKPIQITVTDYTTSTAADSSDTNLITGRTLYYALANAGYTTNIGTVTSVRVQATSPVVSSTNTASSTTLDTTISLANAYGDTKNPYGTKTKNYVLAGPTTGSAAAPTFRALVAADIPDLSGTYLTSYTETDPTVPSWAKASSKPSYGLSEITGTDDLRVIEALTGTSGFLKKTAANTWSLDTNTYLTSSSTLDASKLSGAIPSAVTATTQASTDNSTKIATTAYVTTAIANLPEPMLFKGSVGTGGTVTWANLATAAAANEGWTYKVITAHTAETGKPAAKVGDTIISNGSEWIVIPSGDEPSGTVTSVGLVNATNGGLSISNSPITTSGNITVGLDSGYGDTKNPYAAKDANKVLAGPSSGSAAVPSFRTLVAADIPNLSWNKITSDKPTTLSGYGITDAAGLNAFIDVSVGPVSAGSDVTKFTFTRASGTNPKEITISIIASQATGANALIDSNGVVISEGSATQPVFFVNGLPSSANVYAGGTAVTLNGTNKSATTASFYAPTSAGTENQVLIANASGIPTWTNQSSIVGKDEKMKWEASTSTNTYYPLQSTSTAATSTANTLNGISFEQYYNTAGGYRRLNLGNTTAWKSSGGAYGTIRLYGAASTYYGDLVPGVLGTTSGDGHLTANRTWTLPDDTGTIALTKDIPSIPTATQNAATGITASTTATKTTLGTAFTIPNVTSAGSASNWVFEDVACDDITAWSAGSGSFTSGAFSGGSGSFSATVTNHVLSFSHSHTAATHGADSHTHTAPSLTYSAKTASHVKSGGNGTAPSLGTAFTVPNVTGNTSATVSITDTGHVHSI